jgi:hypothetical protein
VKLSGRGGAAHVEGGDAARARRERAGHRRAVRARQDRRRCTTRAATAPNEDDVKRETIAIALTHHLVSAYTSLVAVDVTPTAPAGVVAQKSVLPGNLPGRTRVRGVLRRAAADGHARRRAQLLAGVAADARSVRASGLRDATSYRACEGSASRRSHAAPRRAHARRAPGLLMPATAQAMSAVTPRAERGGPFGRGDDAARASMRAAATGTAFRFPAAESSPLGIGRRRLRLRALVLVVVALVGAALFGNGAWLYTKAALGQWLLQRAWSEARASGAAVKPWPWADTHPVARLIVPPPMPDELVLAGASGARSRGVRGHLDDSGAARRFRQRGRVRAPRHALPLRAHACRRRRDHRRARPTACAATTACAIATSRTSPCSSCRARRSCRRSRW